MTNSEEEISYRELDILMLIKSRGFFVNKQRRVIIQILSRQCEPITVEELWLSIRRLSQKVCISSIHNNLKLFMKEGFLEKDVDQKGKTIYSLPSPGERGVPGQSGPEASQAFALSAFAQNTDKLLKSYIGVKNALVDSDAKAASTAISAFYEAIKSEDDFSPKAGLLKAAEKLNKAGSSLGKQRASFNDVSTLMWKLVKESDAVSSPVYYQYCPMKKAYWLSADKEIKNPYYGSSMLTCGKVMEKQG